MKQDHLEQEILREHSKRQAMKIGRWVGMNRQRFGRLMQCYLQGESVLSQRAAWIMSYCGELHPHLLDGWIPRLLARVEEPGNHIGVRRNGLRVLRFVTVPHRILGKVVAICFDELENPDSPVAVRVYAMDVLLGILENEPGLANEVLAVVHSILPNAGPGLSVCCRRAMKKLGQLKGIRSI